jgi:hypothetical protein
VAVRSTPCSPRGSVSDVQHDAPSSTPGVPATRRHDDERSLSRS